ncbi:MAG: valine--tRNA ligase [Candidatus Bathyarchaeota archaeon]|nr:MAG: valine--tRNA ligase [Candidatus Bathyarchaeota archaeon]
MRTLPKKIDFLAAEEKWQQKWEEWGIYHFDWKNRSKSTFSIDTPPPYPSGEFHMGNVLNWVYIDIVARYKRMRGFNVHFPQGWDCHGLQIERRTENEYGIEKSGIPTAEFIRLCKRFVDKYVDIMKTAVKQLGCSNDWTMEYKTMNPDYWRRTQLSFIILYRKGYIYQGTHPVNWCPNCETAIADAEVNYESHQGDLFYIKFLLEEGGHLIVATTRPELIPACVTVAINPKDNRFRKYAGRNIVTPISRRAVKIIKDNMVDPKFGSGVVMICTFGDKADVKTVAKYELPVTEVITKDGKMNRRAGKYEGLTLAEAKTAIADDLEKQGLMVKREPVQQEIGLCDRCGAPIEILETKQWFMRTRKLTEQVEKTANTIKWHPDYMKTRLIDWAKSLDWDWVISRQRVFGTPIPIWYCQECGEIILADEDSPPIDPKQQNPNVSKCPRCNHTKFTPERDVFDTWMDSSITCAVHAGWPNVSETELRRLFPADLHASGTDIIRTWAYYLMVRHLALFNEKPYKTCLINGMVLGNDGRKMSKSLGNYIATPEVFKKYGADTSRQWAAGGGTTGSDIPFRWPDVEYAWRFLIKLWNACRFASLLLKDYEPAKKAPADLPLLDKWLLTKMDHTTVKVGEALERCQFNVVMEEIRNFTWRDLCDNYIEAAKHRLYKNEVYGEEQRRAAQYTLYTALFRVLQIFAPIAPHITEEIYQKMFAEDLKHKSIHLSPWPEVKRQEIDDEAVEKGDLLVAVIREVRREKARKRIPLNAVIKELIIIVESEEYNRVLSRNAKDISGTCRIQKIAVMPQGDNGIEVEGYPDVRFVGV